MQPNIIQHWREATTMNQKHKTQQRKEYIPRKRIKTSEVQPIFSERW